MKSKSIFTYALLAILTVVFNSCSDEADNPPKLTFEADGITYSFKDAKLYLTRKDIGSGREFRQYFISDGVYTNGNGNQGWSLDDYTGETFYFAIEIGAAVSETFALGEFPVYGSWSLASEDSNVAYLYMESGTGNDFIQYYPADDGTDHSPVIVSGGMEDSDKMKIQFDGTLIYDGYDGGTRVRKEVTGKLYYEGIVVDSTP